MNFKRIISSILGIPVVIIVLTFSNQLVISIAFAIIALIAVNEYLNVFKEKANPIRWITYIFALSISLIHLVPQEQLLYIILALIPIVMFILFIHMISSNLKITFYDVLITFFGICYVILFIIFIPLIKQMTDGGLLIWYAIIGAWGTDIFAYLIGKNFGKHHFTKISPNKTIEGSIAGVVGAVIASVIYTYCLNLFLELNFSYTGTVIIAVVFSILAQIGDLAASTIKRHVDAKDFGTLIPGHGGMLDRIDSLIFIAPFAYLIFSIGGLL